MKFERVSFRTTEKERQLLVRLNQRYKCRTVTSFMHKLFQEIDDKQLLQDHTETAKIPDMFGDMDFGLSSVKEQARPDKPTTPDAVPSAQKETDPLLRQIQEYYASRHAKEESKPHSDLLDDIVKDLANLERLRDAFRRASPYK